MIEKTKSIIDFLCGDSGSHDYTINRREATELGLNIEKPSTPLYLLLRKIYDNYSQDLSLSEPFNIHQVYKNVNSTTLAQYSLLRGFVESTIGNCYHFMTEGEINAYQADDGSIGYNDQKTFEGWKIV